LYKLKIQIDCKGTQLNTFKQLSRRIILPLFSKVNPGDITIKHHFTNQPFRLHSFKHKNYWVHGKNREKTTMELFEQLIQYGDVILELGAHIGYITLYLAYLTGDSGKVIAFEPGPTNFRYLSKNTTQQNIIAIQKAVSDSVGQLPFYVEDFSGQNNSLIEGFEGLELNSGHAHLDGNYSYDTVMVDVITLDTAIPELTETVNFIKIDVEGVELKVLHGARQTIESQQPIVMVESIDTDQEVLQYFTELGYALFSPEDGRISDASQMANLNYFCVHPEKHSDAFQILQQQTGN